MNHDDNLRIFIAIPLPPDISDYLSDIISSLKNQFPDDSIKWVRSENIHLTIKFLGNISVSKLAKLYENLDKPIQIEPFQLEISKIGAFPSIYKPRVVWVGLSECKSLYDLSLFLDEGTQFLEMENETSFSPHLTLARTRPGIKKENFEKLKELLAKNRIIEPKSFIVNQFNVYQSTLTPSGPHYSILKIYKFHPK
ncbi:MAG TPA: RNA 2',3'-cyclic phosphodiesterase [Anaerolineaceae bacterium]|nr:RNA 2',3'-cyclic phosphodiesterase [Anaerolineaceae bacterium]